MIGFMEFLYAYSIRVTGPIGALIRYNRGSEVRLRQEAIIPSIPIPVLTVL